MGQKISLHPPDTRLYTKAYTQKASRFCGRPLASSKILLATTACEFQKNLPRARIRPLWTAAPANKIRMSIGDGTRAISFIEKLWIILPAEYRRLKRKKSSRKSLDCVFRMLNR
ncbi:MAG: hypothetical protein NTX50_02335 [Candidatus Sumerlaeota bacterium]|nr:hypothetical protein [Candidatus Sumerlaeota bacterium]